MVFIDYLAAYQNLYLAILTYADIRFPADGEPGTPSSRTVEAHSPNEAAAFSRAYHALTITAGPATRDAAHHATGTLWKLAEMAAAATSRAEFEDCKRAARPHRVQTRQAMRAELGVP